MRGVLSQQRRRHGDATAHRGERVGGKQRLAAQHAVLVGKGKADEFEFVFLDRLYDGIRRAHLLVGP